MILYHGTTKSSLDNILNNGWGDGQRVWECSDENLVYFHSLTLALDEFDGDSENAMSECITHAYHNAEFAAITQETDDNLYVIMVDIPDVYIQEDNTVNPSEYAVCVEFDDLNKYGKIVSIFVLEFNKYLLPFIARDVVPNNQFSMVLVPNELYEIYSVLPNNVCEGYYEYRYYMSRNILSIIPVS